MGVSTRHILQHGPVLSALGRTVLGGLLPGARGAHGIPVLPGPEISATTAPLPRALVDDFVRQVGGDPRAYRDHLPPHLFCQWGFPLATRTLLGLPYPMLKGVNGGCRMEMRAPVPFGEPLHVRASLQSIDDDGRRVLLTSKVITGTAEVPDALLADFHVIVPLHQPQDGSPPRAPRAKPVVPDAAHELMRRRLPRDAGLSFAKLTGDFNPIHWVAPYARASGFRSVILHGFGTLAYSFEGLVRHRLGGDPSRLTMIDVQFKRPLVLPHDVGLYQLDDQIFMGDAPGGPAYMVGRFETEERP